jgi:hypothetical protein
MRALVSLARTEEAPVGGDPGDTRTHRRGLRQAAVGAAREHRGQRVRSRIVGHITDERERQACVVTAENVPGVRAVHDHLVWVEPISGMAFPSPEDEAKVRTTPPKAVHLGSTPTRVTADDCVGGAVWRRRGSSAATKLHNGEAARRSYRNQKIGAN